MEATNNLHLLLSHDDDGSPVLEDGLPSAAAAVQEPEKKTKKKDEGEGYWEAGDPPGDLEAQRWGVIAPEGPEGDHLLALIRPLIEARKEGQGGADIKIYRAPPKLSPAEATRWRKTKFHDGKGGSTDLPRYQLLLGDLHQLPLSLQQLQGIDGYVGRLCFREDRGYEAYVEKVLRHEKAPAKVDTRAKLFTVHDGSRATMSGYQALIQPAMALLREFDYKVEELGDPSTPSSDEFLEVARSPDPTVLFSVSHGVGPPFGGWTKYEHQLERQGALKFGRDERITGADLGEGPFLPGGIWFMLACYGAGTPAISAYKGWLERLRKLGKFSGPAASVLEGLPAENKAPFIASLPQAALARPDGPLAVVGHVDLAWTYSFEERDTGAAVHRPARFMEVVRSVLRGDRVGIAYQQLPLAMSTANHEIAELYSEREEGAAAPDEARLAHLWMLRQDLAGYILLGDPAVRMPSSGKTKRRRGLSARYV